MESGRILLELQGGCSLFENYVDALSGLRSGLPLSTCIPLFRQKTRLPHPPQISNPGQMPGPPAAPGNANPFAEKLARTIPYSAQDPTSETAPRAQEHETKSCPPDSGGRREHPQRSTRPYA